MSDFPRRSVEDTADDGVGSFFPDERIYFGHQAHRIILCIEPPVRTIATIGPGVIGYYVGARLPVEGELCPQIFHAHLCFVQSANRRGIDETARRRVNPETES